MLQGLNGERGYKGETGVKGEIGKKYNFDFLLISNQILSTVNKQLLVFTLFMFLL